MSKTKYEEKKQREFDKFFHTYETEGIPLPPHRFPISFFMATMIARSAFKEEYGELCPRYIVLHADDLDGFEVARDVVIVKEGSSYFLEYQDADQMETLVEEWTFQA